MVNENDLISATHCINSNRKCLFEIKTANNHIKIVEEHPIRKMLFGSGLCEEQSAINVLDLNEHVYDYSRLVLYSLFLFPDPKNILIAGLGGAVVPNQFTSMFPEINIDILEIDPNVVELSKKYFNFKESEKVKVHIGDAFQTISDLDKKYDLVVLDVFNNRYIPYHIMCYEFLTKVYNSLNDKGVVVINTCNDHPSFFHHLNTIINAFVGCSFYREDGSNNRFNSVIFIAKNLSETDKINKMVISDDILKSTIFKIAGY